MVTISDYWLAILLGTVLPAVTALVAARLASPGVKAVVLLFLSAVAGWLASVRATGGVFEWRAALLGVGVSFGSAVVTHYGLLKPVGVTGTGGVIARAVPGGVGARPVPVGVGMPGFDPGAPGAGTPGGPDAPYGGRHSARGHSHREP